MESIKQDEKWKMQGGVLALRARRFISMAGELPAAGQALWASLPSVDNALLLLGQGKILYAGPFAEKWVPVGAQRRDLGEVTLVPAVVNAHTHLQLSHLSEATLWGKGFVPWLASLIPLLAQPLQEEAVRGAVHSMCAVGTAFAGDFTSHGMALVARLAAEAGLGCTLLAEWFGMEVPEGDSPWPVRCRPVLDDVPLPLMQDAVPCGHALYSTHARLLQAAQRWCAARHRPFVMHLAECEEETEMLLDGKGALRDLYTPKVLTEQWRAPGMRPVPLAAALGLLAEGTLAVHGVHCDARDRALLAAHNTKVCLCPRSNKHLGVGEAPSRELAQAGVILCLGTDGLTSNVDLNVWEEAVYLHERGLFPVQALLRMLTCNGAAALGLKQEVALREGAMARWSILPSALE